MYELDVTLLEVPSLRRAMRQVLNLGETRADSGASYSLRSIGRTE
jgi:hypothetical protein